jgi:hypothetical protein
MFLFRSGVVNICTCCAVTTATAIMSASLQLDQYKVALCSLIASGLPGSSQNILRK